MKLLLLYGYLLIIVILSIYGFHRYYIIFLFKKYKKKVAVPKQYFKKLPRVTIQLPVFNEKYVVERLIDVVCNIRYPKNLLEIQVLDDSTDDTKDKAKAKCVEKKKQGIDIQFIHRVNRQGFKAGALENGLKTAKGEFIAIFDADFVPNEDFLEKTVHYFTDEKIGMIQTRWDHLNRSYSLLTECQSILLDGHFMLEHTARNRSGRFFNFNGTAGVWRKNAISDAGGWQHDTLTEDLDLSYRAQLKGWQFLYLPHVTVPAELPVEMTAFKAQQFRWAKGSIQTFIKLFGKIIKSNIAFKQKIETFFHIGANFAYVLMLILSILLPINLMARLSLETTGLKFFDLPIFFLATFSVMLFYLYTEYVVINETLTMKGKSKLKSALYMPVVLAMGIGLSINNCKAVFEALIRKNTPFNRTPKYNVVDDDRKLAIQSTVSGVTSNVYRLKEMNWVVVVEYALGIYFTFTVLYLLVNKLYSSIPFTMLFQFGFLYTALLSSGNIFMRRKSVRT